MQKFARPPSVVAQGQPPSNLACPRACPRVDGQKTSHHRHLTAGLIDAACQESQQVAYRTASQNLADVSGWELLIAAFGHYATGKMKIVKSPVNAMIREITLDKTGRSINMRLNMGGGGNVKSG